MNDEEKEEEIYKTTGRVAFATALPLLIFTLISIVIIGLIAFQRVRQVGGNATIFDAAFPVCSGVPLETATLYSRDKESSIHPAIAFSENNGFLQGASNYVKPEWLPENSDELELVLCAQPARPAFRALCSDRNVVNQFGGEVPFQLRSARTGGIIAEGVIVGDDAARVECLEEVDPGQVNIDASVPDEAIQAFMAQFVEP